MGLLDSKVLKNSSFLKSQTLSTVKEEKDEDRFASSNRKQRFTDFKELEMSSSNEDIMLSKSPGVRSWRGGREDLLSRNAALEAESALLRNEILHQNIIIQDLKSEKTQMDRICNIVKKYLMRKKVFQTNYVQSVQLLEYVIDFCQVHKFFYIDSGGQKTRQEAETIIPQVQKLLDRIQLGFGNLSELGTQLDTNDQMLSVLKDSVEQTNQMGGLANSKRSKPDSQTSNLLDSQLYQINLDSKQNDFSGDFILSKSQSHKPLFSPDLPKQHSLVPTHESDISVTSPESKGTCQFKMIFTNQNHSLRNSNSTNPRSSEEPGKDLLPNRHGKENLRLMDLGFNKAKVLRNNFTFEVPDSAACATEETKGEKTASQRESNVRNTEPQIDPFQSQKNESENKNKNKNSKTKNDKEKAEEKVVYICSIEQELSSEKKSYVVEGKNQEIVIKEREGAKQKRDIYKQIFWRGSVEKQKGNLKNIGEIGESIKATKKGLSSEIESRFEWTYDKKDAQEGRNIEMDLGIGSQVQRNREQFARDLISAEKPRKKTQQHDKDLFAAKRTTLTHLPQHIQAKEPQRRKTRRPDSLDDSQNNNFLLIRKASLNSQTKQSMKTNSRSNSFSKGDNIRDSISNQSKGAISITNSIGTDDRFSPAKFNKHSKKPSSGKTKQAEMFFQKKRESFGKRQSFSDLIKRRASLTNETDNPKKNSNPESPERVSELSLDGKNQINPGNTKHMLRIIQTPQHQGEIKRRERSQSQSGGSLSRNPAVLIINKTPNLMENFSFNYTEMNYSRCSSKLSNQHQTNRSPPTNPFSPKLLNGQPSLQIQVNNTSPSSSCRTPRSNPSFSGDTPNQRSKFMADNPNNPTNNNIPNINNFQTSKADNTSNNNNNMLKDKPGYEPRTSAFTRSGEERDSRTIEESFVDFAKTTQNSKNNVFKEHSDGFTEINHGQRHGRRPLGFASKESLEESSIVESEVIDLQNSMDIQSNYGNLLPKREDFKQLPPIQSVADLKSDKEPKQTFTNRQNQIKHFLVSDNQQKRIAYTRNNEVKSNQPKTKPKPKSKLISKNGQQNDARNQQYFMPNTTNKILQNQNNLDLQLPNLENSQNTSNTLIIRAPNQDPGHTQPRKMTLTPKQQNAYFLKQKENSLCTLYTNSHIPQPQIHYNTFDQNDSYNLARNEGYRQPQRGSTPNQNQNHNDSTDTEQITRQELSLQTNYNYERRSALSGLSIGPAQILVFQPKRHPQKSLQGLLRKKTHERRNAPESQTSIYGNSFQQKDAKTSFYKHSPVPPKGQRHASKVSLPPFPLNSSLDEMTGPHSGGNSFYFSKSSRHLKKASYTRRPNQRQAKSKAKLASMDLSASHRQSRLGSMAARPAKKFQLGLAKREKSKVIIHTHIHIHIYC